MQSRRLFRNVFSNWASFVLNIVIAFFMSPIVVRELGNAYYGLWVLLVQLTGCLGILEFGVRSSVVKYVAEYHGQDNRQELNAVVSGAISMYGVIAVVSLLASVVVAACLPLIINIPPDDLATARWVLLITGATVAQDFVFNVFFGVLMGVQRWDLFNGLVIVVSVIRAGLVLFFLQSGFGIVALAVIQLVTNVATNLGAFALTRREIPYLKTRWFSVGRDVYRKILGYSLTSFLITASWRLTLGTDALIIGMFLSTTFVTYYAIPKTLVNYMRLLVIAMTEVFIPLTSELSAKAETQRIQALLIRGTKTAILIGLPICAVLLAMGTRFIELWMGAEYAQAGRQVLLVLTITHVISLTHLTSREILFGLARHRINLYLYGLEAVANLALSLMLVRRWGIVGVAIGMAIPHIIVSLFVFPVAICRVLRLSVRDYVSRAFVPAFAAGVPFAVAAYAVDRLSPAHTLMGFFGQVLAVLPIFLTSVWFVALTRDERAECARFALRLLARRGALSLGSTGPAPEPTTKS